MAARTLTENAATHKCAGLGCAFASACGRYLRPEAENQLWAAFYAIAWDDCDYFESCEVFNHV